jgi:hypothetical protein
MQVDCFKRSSGTAASGAALGPAKFSTVVVAFCERETRVCTLSSAKAEEIEIRSNVVIEIESFVFMRKALCKPLATNHLSSGRVSAFSGRN